MDRHVQFEEESDITAPENYSQKESFLVRTATAIPGVDNKKKADVALLGVAVVCFLTTVLLSARLLGISFYPQSSGPELTQEELDILFPDDYPYEN